LLQKLLIGGGWTTELSYALVLLSKHLMHWEAATSERAPGDCISLQVGN